MKYYLLFLSLFIWPFGQLLAFSFPGFPFTVYLLDIVLGLLMALLIIDKKAKEMIIRDPLFRPLMIFNLVAAFSLLFNLRSLIDGGSGFALLYLARLFIYPSVYFAGKLYGGKKVLITTMVSFSILCVLGIVQYLIFPDMRYLKQIGFDDHYFRLIGSLYDPNFSGALLAGASLLFIALGNWIVALPLTVLLALTFSRASYLCFVLGILYLLIKNKKYWFLLFLLALLGIVWVIPKPFGEGVNLFRTFSIYSRFDSWRDGLDLFLKRPILGWGYNTLRDLTGSRFQIDNSLIFVSATTGLIGLLAFFNLLKQSLLRLSLPNKVFILTLLVHSLFNNSFFYIWINYAYWLILSLPVREYKEE
jgi:O-antigen ligase